MTPVALSPFDLAVAGLLVAASAAASALLALGIQRTLLVAALRMVVQLLLVGFMLRLVFAAASPWITAAVVAAMLTVASREVGARSPRRLAGPWHLAVGALTAVAATLPLALVVLTTALRPHPWYDPRHAIPLVGILLGTVMNAGSLSISSLTGSVARERAAIEARLCLGATREEALRPVLRQAVLAGMLPSLNQMAAAGIITLPGIMTGQVLAGMDPIVAATYQILLMFVLATGAFLGSLLAAVAAMRRLTDDRHRLRLDRLAAAR
jgi:putative ABC transport system permease protein